MRMTASQIVKLETREVQALIDAVYENIVMSVARAHSERGDTEGSATIDDEIDVVAGLAREYMTTYARILWDKMPFGEKLGYILGYTT